MPGVPLGVLDLVPIASGSTAGEALRNSISLVAACEGFGYQRYWFAEHHLNPGVAGTSPAVLLALSAPVTSSIRLGSGAVQMGHRTALSTVEEFGLIEAAYPGRIDLGLGRSGGTGRPVPAPGKQPATARRTDEGLLLPVRFPVERLQASPRIGLQRSLLSLPDARAPDYGEQVEDVLALLGGEYQGPQGQRAQVVPGEHADMGVPRVASVATTRS